MARERNAHHDEPPMNAVCFAVVLAVAWGYLAAATFAVWRFSRRPLGRPDGAYADQRPVSVLKPLHGAEPGLSENLRSFADQDYPTAQIVLGLRDPGDSALAISRALIRDRPDCDIALVINSRVRGSNLKVANLENMLPAVRHQWIVLADSDMRVARDYLSVIAEPLAHPGTGIVTCLYKGVTTGRLWSRLAAMQINFSFLPGAVVGDAMKVGGGCFGATIALRRDVLDRIGGFARLRDELADDHRMGAAVRDLGLNVVLSRYVVENRVTESSLGGLWRHELRWARTSRLMAPAGFAGSVTTHTVILTALGAAFFGSGLAAWGAVVLALLLRWASAAAMARWLDLPRRGLWLLPLRDALSFAVFLSSFCGRRVQWGERLFRIAPDGHMRIEGDKAA
jgi:ceramide glucosyltransferase